MVKPAFSTILRYMELPTKEQILAYLTSQGTTMTKRELVDAFGISGNDRIGFKQIIHAMEDEGLIIYEGKKSYRVPEALPAVTIVEVTDIDIDGDEIAVPVEWNEEVQGKMPRIEIMPAMKGRPALKIGDLALVQLSKVSVKVYEARVLKRVDSQQAKVVGLIKQVRGGYVLQPIDRKAKYDFDISEEDFRYPGPKPQFREAALCMLADSIEAAGRSLDEPTPVRLQNIVRNIIQRKFMEGQLDECSLTLKDLSRVEAAFTKILLGIYHQRIDYPRAAGGGASEAPQITPFFSRPS